MTEQDIGQDTDRTPAGSPVLPSEKLLTIAQAAKALGLDPKQIRRYAEKLTGQDRTPAGQSPVRVRLSAVIALRDGLKSEAEMPKGIGQDKDRTGQDKPAESVLPVRTEGSLDALVYQQRISDLEAMNAELKADKERLYGLLETAQGNLAREQALRSIPAPAVEITEAPKPEDPKAETEPVGWWARLWGKG